MISIVPKSSRAQERHDSFIQAINGHIKDCLAMPLTILVWGPGKSYENADGMIKMIGEKRVEMLNTLRLEGHNAIFSEELNKEIEALKEIGNFKIEELIQAHCADMICLLWGSSGSIGEAHDFCNRKEIAQKTILFIEKNDKEFYGEGMIEIFESFGGKVEKFDENDLKVCNVVKKAVKFASTLRKGKYLEIQTGGIIN